MHTHSVFMSVLNPLTRWLRKLSSASSNKPSISSEAAPAAHRVVIETNSQSEVKDANGSHARMLAHLKFYVEELDRLQIQIKPGVSV